MTRNLILDPLEESNNLLKNERDDLRRRLVEMERENAALRKRQEYGPFTPGESQVNPASPPAGMEPRGEDALSALAGSEQRMRSFIESMNDLIFVLDHDLTIREYHAPRDDALYVPAEHFLGKNVDAVGFPEPAGAIIKDALIQALQSGKMTRAEYYLQEAKGLSWFDLKITLFEEKKDPQTYLTCVVRDITAYKQAEIKLRESEKQYRMLFETSMDGILLTSPDGRITAANPAACSMVGMTEAELIQSGRPGMVDLSDPSNRAALEERARSGYFKGEMTFIRKDGTRFPAELSSVIYQAADGEGQQSNIIFRDISERKRIEEALKSEQFLVRTVIDNIPDQIFVRDRSCRFILNNLSDARMMGGFRPRNPGGQRR